MSNGATMMVSDLEPHPFSEELFKQDEPSSRFIQSIDEELENPIIVNQDGLILDGVRRWKAATALDWDSIPVDTRDYGSTEMEQLAILRHNDDREETFSQKMRIALQYKELVAPMMEKRIEQSEKVDFADLSENSPQLDLADAEGKTTRELVGDRIGWSGSKFYYARKVWEAAEGGENYSSDISDFAKELVKDLDGDKKSVYGAWTDLKERIERESSSPTNEVPWNSIEKANLLNELRTVETIYDVTEPEITTEESWTVGLQKLSQAYDDHSGEPVKAGEAPIFVYLMERNGLANLSEDDDSVAGSIAARRPDADLLDELYNERDIAPLELAIRYGVTESLVRFWLREDDISMKRGDFSESQLRMMNLN
ncbi:ParB N-terminal domain-containing protein [Halobaculum halobium]|uniref:ParB N-terminal domain-containing protein n=1 Tax=Halobaculum halobium TaxID=3032281 RepID=A0ABD5TAW6_9EURY|nr:ParB N-terminal domain-containing protein [Halobaculum sp. SYNS20]